jgi:hypothetical protein
MKQGIWNLDHIGDPVFDGLTFGGQLLVGDLDGGVFTKSEYPGLRAIRDADGTVILARDLADPYTPAAAVDTVGPAGLIGYAAVTANQTGITTEADLTGLAATVTVSAGRYIRITGSIRYGGTTVDDVATLRIKEGTTLHQTSQMSIGRNTTQANPYMERSVILTPTAGSHIYKLTLERSVGTGNMQMVASVGAPAFIAVEDLGPVTPAEADAGVMELYY